MKKDVDDNTLKAMILDWLLRNKKVGEMYMPSVRLERTIWGKIRRNGSRVRRLVRQLTRDGFLQMKKRGDVISVRYSSLKQANEYRKRHLY